MTTQARFYRETGRRYWAARVEWHREGETLPYRVDVYPFASFAELFDFELWMDATVALVTGAEPTPRLPAVRRVAGQR